MIREAEIKDFKIIYILGEEVQKNFKKKFNLENLIEESYFHILVYEENGKVVGFIIYTLLEKTVDIVELVVHSDYRNKKIATNLLDAMITNSNVDTTFFLEVAVDNFIAIKLYEKFGFETIYTRQKYYGQKDAYVMERRPQ